MAMNFVSEKDLNEKKEGEEEEEYDPRPLFERLKAEKDKKQAEADEERDIKRQFHQIDDDEREFLRNVDNVKLEAERQKKLEEMELVKVQREAMNNTVAPSTSFPMPKIQAGFLKSKAKQQEAPNGLLIRKRKLTDEDNKIKSPTINQTSIVKRVGEYPSIMVSAGSLPGVGMYESSSDDSFDEDSFPTNNIIMKSINTNNQAEKIDSKKSVSPSKSGSNSSLNRTE